MVVLPTSKGTDTVQDVVPAAVPESPFEVDHFTAVTPRSSEALPLNVSAALSVETIVVPGEAIRSVGGLVSLDGGFCGGLDGTGVGPGVGVGAGTGVGAAGGWVGGGTGMAEPGTPYR